MKTRNSGLVVVVEDEEELRRSLVFTLLRSGYRVSAHATAISALEDLRRIRSNSDSVILLITEIDMPGSDGVAFLRQARSISPNLPILIITGHANKESRRSLLELGVIRILDKPFHLQELVSGIAKLRRDAL